MKSNEKRLLPFASPSKQHGSASKGGNSGTSNAQKGDSPFKLTSFLSSIAGSNQPSPEPEKEETLFQGKYTKEMIEKMEEELDIAKMKIEEMESQFQTQRDIFKQSTRALADENQRLHDKVTELEKKIAEPAKEMQGDPGTSSEETSPAPVEGGGEDKEKEENKTETKDSKTDEMKGREEEKETETKEEIKESEKEETKKVEEKEIKEDTPKGQAEQTSNESLMHLSAMLREAEDAAEKAKEETEQVRNESKAKIDELTREIESINRHGKVLEIKVEYW